MRAPNDRRQRATLPTPERMPLTPAPPTGTRAPVRRSRGSGPSAAVRPRRPPRARPKYGRPKRRGVAGETPHAEMPVLLPSSKSGTDIPRGIRKPVMHPRAAGEVHRRRRDGHSRVRRLVQPPTTRDEIGLVPPPSSRPTTEPGLSPSTTLKHPSSQRSASSNRVSMNAGAIHGISCPASRNAPRSQESGTYRTEDQCPAPYRHLPSSSTKA
jgi:hypothetical protein